MFSFVFIFFLFLFLLWIEAQTTTAAPPLRGDDYEPSIEETDTESDIGVDEATPPTYEKSCASPKACSFSSTTYCPEKECDGVQDCPYGDDEASCEKTPETTGTYTEHFMVQLYLPTPLSSTYHNNIEFTKI